MMSFAPNGIPLSGPVSVAVWGLPCTHAWIRGSLSAMVSRHLASARDRASGEALIHSASRCGLEADKGDSDDAGVSLSPRCAGTRHPSADDLDKSFRLLEERLGTASFADVLSGVRQR